MLREHSISFWHKSYEVHILYTPFLVSPWFQLITVTNGSAYYRRLCVPDTHTLRLLSGVYNGTRACLTRARGRAHATYREQEAGCWPRGRLAYALPIHKYVNHVTFLFSTEMLPCCEKRKREKEREEENTRTGSLTYIYWETCNTRFSLLQYLPFTIR